MYVQKKKIKKDNENFINIPQYMRSVDVGFDRISAISYWQYALKLLDSFRKMELDNYCFTPLKI